MTNQRGRDAANAGGMDAPGPIAVQAAELLQRMVDELTDPQSTGFGRCGVEVVIQNHRVVGFDDTRQQTRRI